VVATSLALPFGLFFFHQLNIRAKMDMVQLKIQECITNDVASLYVDSRKLKGTTMYTAALNECNGWGPKPEVVLRHMKMIVLGTIKYLL
jgi:hypothetical protein